jgi:hypothetical protein
MSEHRRSKAVIQQWLDQEDAWMRDTVRRHGWALQYVTNDGQCSVAGCTADHSSGSDDLPFAYTVGLHGYGHPELLVFGLDMATSGSVLNGLGEYVREGEPLIIGDTYGFDGWQHAIHLFPLRDSGAVLISANRYYQRRRTEPVPALQCVWSDDHYRFPWEPDCTGPAVLQPLPDTFEA